MPATLDSATAMTDPPSHPVGFNNQTHYDPFLSSNHSEESLVPVHSDHSPGPQSFHSPSPPLTSATIDGKLQSATDQAQHTHLPQLSLSNGFNHTPATHPRIENDSGDAGYGFLSPNPYPSDNGYNASSEHTATPDYDRFYLEEDYGILASPIQEPLSSQPASPEQSHLNQRAVELDDPRKQFAHRSSNGTATMSSSHLMSPVLTDAPGTSTRDGTASPPDRKNGLIAVAVGTAQAETAHQAHQFGSYMQQTPTNTSKGSSPDRPQAVLNLVGAASPLIRVEKYARGDSPARLPDHGNGAKRSRAGSRSSHLVVHEDDGLSDEPDNGRFDQRTDYDPHARYQVRNVEVLNFKDQEDSAQRALKNADVEDWLERSASGSEAGAGLLPDRPRDIGKRQRARSVGSQALSHANLETLRTIPPDSHLPDPGVLIHVSSGGEEESEDKEEIISIEDSPIATHTEGMNDVPGEARPGVYDELPNQPPLYRAKPWQDGLHDSSDPGVKMQPVTSNDAIARFQQRAADVDTLSRVATWGTRRRSESDMQSLFSRLTFTSEQKFDSDRLKRERSGSFLQQAAAKLVPRRTSTLKRKESDKSKQNGPTTRPGPGEPSMISSCENRTDSGLTVPQAAPKGLQRMGSLGKRPKSPRINTGSAVAAMAGQMAALGSSSPLGATAASPPPGPWKPAKHMMRPSRSRSDLNNASTGFKGATELGLAELWTKQGGPPMPALVAPKTHDPAQASGFGNDDDDDDNGDEDEDDAIGDNGVKIDLSMKPDAIVPTLDGFKANIRGLNPRLPAYMFDRVAQEQLRRYKKLMDFKIKHAQAVNIRKCSSGRHCTELGGGPTYLPSKSSKDAEQSHIGCAISGPGPSDDDIHALTEGSVTPSQFPAGVPMPPAKRLPAEFECSLCFTVKRFHKPSDWSKHVHEDVQPFTCTFETCVEPKSFKRKADWVRHENERHRKLEWWQCNMHDCDHRCYRKDNFVQHLVREHKLPEPKAKTAKAGKPAVRGPSSQKARTSKLNSTFDDFHDGIDQVWKMVEECRHETLKDPKDEACKFCGTVCNSWKKLTVHLAKHMEQISMPVLGVVKEKKVTPDTIISPIEQRINTQPSSKSSVSQGPTNPSFSAPAVNMSDVPPGFAAQPSHPAYFSHTSQSQYPRVSANTYPPLTPPHQLATSFTQNRRTPHLASGCSRYGGSSTAQCHSVNGPQTCSSGEAGSSEQGYGSITAPTSLSDFALFHDSTAYQYVSQPQEQAYYPVEGPVYHFGSASPAAYPQQQAMPVASYPLPTQTGISGPTCPPQNQMGREAGIGPSMAQMHGFTGNGGTTVYGQPGKAAFGYLQ
ncbi:MAG: hypothetical protein Q9163_003088 [Psora crenata]